MPIVGDIMPPLLGGLSVVLPHPVRHALVIAVVTVLQLGQDFVSAYQRCFDPKQFGQWSCPSSCTTAP